tara:strand:+ start:915 stop:1811 length:897 start_codon:yes stop_codon:yes gene_type:complete
MKANIYSIDGKKGTTLSLPKQFQEVVRPDLIKKANEVIEANNTQPYGAFVGAGVRAAAELSRRRKKFKSSYGRGISRVPRKHLWRRGTQFAFVGAFAPGTISGRRAHPPKSSKDMSKKMNKNERRFAIRSAISATVIPELVKSHGHRFTELAFVVDSKIESLSKTKDVKKFMLNLKLEEELKRISKKKIRPGKGKARGRKYKTKKGPLFVVARECPLLKSASSIHGVDVCEVKNLNVGLLAPGGTPGRFTIYSQGAIKKLDEEKLFFQKKNKDATKLKKKVSKKKTEKTTKKIGAKKE